MTRDDGSLIDLEELADVLRAHEGPPRPAARRSRAPQHRLRRLRLRWTIAAAAAALLVGSGLGFGLAGSFTPKGEAGDPPAGLGFLPERGWHVVRSRFEASPERPSFAIASNVPLAREDAWLAGRPKFSGHPYVTLQTLEPGGIVLVASFALRGVHEPSDRAFPGRRLPLRLRDAISTTRQFARPLGWYELRAAVGEHNVTVNVYFGTERPPRASVVAAQRQLDRLVVGSTRPAARVDERALPLGPSTPTGTVAQAAPRVVDRTFACSPIAFGGVGDLDVWTRPAQEAFGRRYPAMLHVRTGASMSDSSLVFVRATFEAWSPGGANPWPVQGQAGAFAHSRRCAAIRASVRLSPSGLGGLPTQWGKQLDCVTRGHVLVRVRSVLRSPAPWRRFDATYAGARSPVVSSKLAVRSQQTGKPIAYMEHDAKGGIKLWYAPTCS